MSRAKPKPTFDWKELQEAVARMGGGGLKRRDEIKGGFTRQEYADRHGISLGAAALRIDRLIKRGVVRRVAIVDMTTMRKDGRLRGNRGNVYDIVRKEESR